MRAPAAVPLFLAVLLAVPGSATAFHAGGVASCAGCHITHASQQGVPTIGPGGRAELLGDTATDTCLRCHAAFGQFAGGQGFGPGGDFYWLTRTWSWTAGGRSGVSAGDSHGHNLVAPAYGLARDALRSTAPGGTFLSADLGCTSCHDPHGNGNFRLLYGAGQGPLVEGGRFVFTNPAPLARGNGPVTIAGVPDAGDETDSRHTIYKSGMSAWCANCHAGHHDNGGGRFEHPVTETLGSDQARQYNRYLGTGNPTGGTSAVAWWSLVPFEATGVNLATADPAAWTAGPGTSDRVMCLTCHRAHASPFRMAGRWDFDAALIAQSHPLPTDGGATAADVTRKNYGYVFAPTQGSLCQKCHLEVPGSSRPTFEEAP